MSVNLPGSSPVEEPKKIQVEAKVESEQEAKLKGLSSRIAELYDQKEKLTAQFNQHKDIPDLPHASVGTSTPSSLRDLAFGYLEEMNKLLLNPTNDDVVFQKNMEELNKDFNDVVKMLDKYGGDYSETVEHLKDFRKEIDDCVKDYQNNNIDRSKLNIQFNKFRKYMEIPKTGSNEGITNEKIFQRCSAILESYKESEKPFYTVAANFISRQWKKLTK